LKNSRRRLAAMIALSDSGPGRDGVGVRDEPTPACLCGKRHGAPASSASQGQLTEHETRSVFARYNFVSDGDLRTAAAQLGGLTGVALKEGLK
jgi:hypothetical protein